MSETVELTAEEQQQEIEEKKRIAKEFELETDEQGNIKGSKDKRLDEDGKPGPGHPRWDKLYGQLKESQRTIDDLLEAQKKDKEDYNKTMDEFRTHNNDMMKRLESMGADIKDMAEEVDDAKGEDIVLKLEAELTDLQTKRAEARKEHEHDEADKLSDAIADKKIEIIEAKREKANPKSTVDDRGITQEERAVEAAAIAKFKSTYTWFDGDGEVNEKMTNAAIALDNELKIDAKWKDKSLDDRFAEVGKRIEEMYKDGGKSEKKDPPSAQTVESDSNIGAVTREKGKTKVTLTDEELEVARKFGISPEAYAKQKALR